jgi:Glyoxalase-like domain
MGVAEDQKPAPGTLCIDHVSHFVADLDAAADVFEKLGLTVTTTSIQRHAEGPVGASNRCVMLAEGYIELLMPTHDTPAANRMRGLMARYPGVQLLCFGTPDAEGERRRLDDHGFVAQPMLHLERRVGKRTARFEVVRAEPAKMPEGRVQFVRQLTPELLWRSPHVNDLRLSSVFVVADDAPQVAARWARFCALLPKPEGDRIRLETARGSVEIAETKVWQALLGEAPPPPALAGYALRCKDPEAFLSRCKKAGLDVHGQAVRLPPVLGGAWLILPIS